MLFLSDRLGSMSLWGVAVRDGVPSTDPVLVKPDMERAIPIGLTHDGTLFYTLIVDGMNVFVANLNAETGQSAPPVQVSQLNVRSNLQPAWSPDGTKLAYITQRGSFQLPFESETDRLTVLELQSGTARTLSPGVPVLRMPQWAPDGASLLVRGFGHGNNFYQINSLTGDVMRVAPDGGRFIGWLPDGSGFYHQRDNERDRERVTET